MPCRWPDGDWATTGQRPGRTGRRLDWDRARGHGGCRRGLGAEERSCRAGRRARHGGSEIATPPFYRATAPAGAAGCPFRILVRVGPVSRRSGRLCNDVQNPSVVWTIPHGAARVGPFFQVGSARPLRPVEGAPPLAFPPRTRHDGPVGVPRYRPGQDPAQAQAVAPGRPDDAQSGPSTGQSGACPFPVFPFSGPGSCGAGPPHHRSADRTSIFQAPGPTCLGQLPPHRLVFGSAPLHEVSCSCLPPSVPESSC
jgi:hypothetical protein